MTTQGFALNGYTLDPGTVYSKLDDAMLAASCLCGLHPEGSTIYVTTDLQHADPSTGEAYVIANRCNRSDGSTWPVPNAPFYPVYTITKATR